MLDPKKCFFLRKKVQFLGHEIGNGEIRPCEDKIAAIRNYTAPNTVKRVRSFLGFLSFFRRFIPNFADRSRALRDLTKKDAKFIWGPEQEEAFQDLKAAMCSYPVLKSPNYDEQFYVWTDASDFCVGALLMQGGEKGDHIVACSSRALKKGELKMSVYQKELTAIVFACSKFRPYLLGRKFTVFCDHYPLKYLHDHKDTGLKADYLKAKLLNYDFDIQYVPGTKQKSDFLSRLSEISQDGQELERPRKELLKLADEQLELSSESESENAFIGAITTRRRINRKKVNFDPSVILDESESDEEYHPRKKQHQDDSIITGNKPPEKLKNLQKEDKWRENIPAASTPRVMREGRDEANVQLPKPVRRRGRKPRVVNEPSYTPRHRAMDHPKRAYSPILSSEIPLDIQNEEIPQLARIKISNDHPFFKK